MILRYCPRCGGSLIEREEFGALRYVCSVCDYILFQDPKVVAVVLVIHDGQVLLGRRNMNPAMGEWSFPGGYVNRGEDVTQAAIREIREEANLDVTLTGLLGVYSAPGDPVVVIVYTADVTSDLNDMRPQPEEVSELRFFAPDALPKVAFDSEKRIITEWRNHLIQP